MTQEKRLEIIESVVRRTGINGTYLGLRCLVYGVDLAYREPRKLSAVTKELYPDIARLIDGNSKAVERNLRTVMSVCWKWGDRAFLDELAGFPLREQPTSGEMIDYLVHYFRRTGLLEENAEKSNEA